MTNEFTITNKKGETFNCLIDDEDADLLNMSWHVVVSDRSNTFYLRNTVRSNPEYGQRIHRVIMARMLGRELVNGEEVDHEDLNGLNNIRANLRLATKTQNRANSRTYKSNKTGFKGVMKYKDRFMAQISIKSKSVYLGLFDTPEEAHAAYLSKAKELFGDFARGE